jgi:hypothetical protein
MNYVICKKVDGTEDHHTQQEKPKFKRPNTMLSHSSVQSKHKTMMIVIIVMGRECKWGLSRGDQ